MIRCGYIYTHYIQSYRLICLQLISISSLTTVIADLDHNSVRTPMIDIGYIRSLSILFILSMSKQKDSEYILCFLALAFYIWPDDVYILLRFPLSFLRFLFASSLLRLYIPFTTYHITYCFTHLLY
jgi:phage-related holin